MARIAKPWFSREKDCWMAYIQGRKVRLADGKKNKQAAKDRLADLQHQSRFNPSEDDPQTVASVIEAYLEHASKRLADSTMAMRKPYLESFAEAHGFRPIKTSKPLHMQSWLDEHPEWKSDWTKNGAIRNVHVAFNWAWKARLISDNPFRGVSHRVGAPRRNMLPEEFQAILRSSAGTWPWKKVTPGARFRQVLMFLWRTGARPSEASKLCWSHVNFETCVAVLTAKSIPP